eukprot:3284764-Pleurochrysis_carterae.AAC.4
MGSASGLIQVVVHSVLKRHRGVSPSNPYLQPSPMTYTHEVQPSALAERVMSAALLIASEWEEDFALIAAENEEQWRRRTPHTPPRQALKRLKPERDGHANTVPYSRSAGTWTRCSGWGRMSARRGCPSSRSTRTHRRWRALKTSAKATGPRAYAHVHVRTHAHARTHAPHARTHAPHARTHARLNENGVRR